MDHSHAWRGTWDRPMKIDEAGQHPFTIARMTDHNVRGADAEPLGENPWAVPDEDVFVVSTTQTVIVRPRSPTLADEWGE